MIRDNPHTWEMLHILSKNLLTRLSAVGFTCAVEWLPHQMQYRAELTNREGQKFTAVDWSPLTALQHAYATSLFTTQEESAVE